MTGQCYSTSRPCMVAIMKKRHVKWMDTHTHRCLYKLISFDHNCKLKISQYCTPEKEHCERVSSMLLLTRKTPSTCESTAILRVTKFSNIQTTVNGDIWWLPDVDWKMFQVEAQLYVVRGGEREREREREREKEREREREREREDRGQI